MKFLAVVAFCFCLCHLVTCGRIQIPKKTPKMSPPVAQLCNDYFSWRMQDMPQYATFVGIHTYDDLLDDMSEAAYQARYDKCVEYLQQANTLEPTLTDDSDIVNIRVLKYELETYINNYLFKGFYLPINALEGVHVDMMDVFGWMLRNTTADYDRMITRMTLLPTQIDQIIDLLMAGVQMGVTYNNISMKDMDAAIGEYVVVDPTLSPFWKFFADGYPSTFTAAEITSIQNQAGVAITDQVSPAYEKLRQYIVNDYKTRPDIAATTIFQGQAYYDALIFFHTSTNMTAQQIQNIGFLEVARIETEMSKVIVEMGYGNMSTQEFSTMIRDDPNNYYETAAELMAGFDYIVYNLVPPRLPLVFKNIPTAELAVVEDPSPGGAGAHYLAGSYDGTRPGVFYVNTYYPDAQPKYSMITLSLHEGNPGHHLQASHSIESPEFPYFRRVMEDRNYGFSPSRFPIYTYYVEGWALYTENLGFDMGLYGNPLDRYGHYSEEIFRACRLVVDTGMHALGWTRDQAVQYMLDHTASAEVDLQNEIDRYITWPGQALAYKMGQLKISELRMKSETQLGTLFDIKDFHDVVLNSFGSMDIVEEEVNKYISDTLGGGKNKVAKN